MDRIVDLIRSKRRGSELSLADFERLINGYTLNDIADAQMGALLMAGVCIGFSDPESVALTTAMLRCGERLDLSELDRVAVDCCSTGGVGDKVPLIAAPIAAATGVAVPMIVEPSADHVIGTLEKLRSIPGFRTDLNVPEFSEVVSRHGLAFAGQSNALAPADKKLYELRDETATVDSLPLIAASAMSKKLAEDLKGLVVDVKISKGSQLSTRTDARRLAQLMIAIGRRLGVKVQALLTDLEQPLGFTVGKALEIMEVAQTLQGQGPPDLAGLSVEIAARMIYLADPTISIEDARERATAAVEDGTALQTLANVIGAQGGNPEVLQDFSQLPNPAGAVPVMSPREGFVSRISAEDIGRAAVILGTGKDDADGEIDPAVGVVLETKVGQQVFNGTRLCALYYNDDSRLEEAQELVEDAFRISSRQPQPRELVLDLIQG
ncbi:MAG: thymidine phosphorylase [Bryobacterales bacterium]|nr:thymidine phosphorylase [Bryobacterales bacterium]